MTIDYLVAGGGASTPMLAHRALLYASDEEFLDTAVPFLAEAVDRCEAAIVVTSTTTAELLRDGLGRAARGVRFAERSEWYRTPTRALDGYREFLDRSLRSGAPWARIVGEPPHRRSTGPSGGPWTRYEAMLNLAFCAEPVSILCPYDVRELDDEHVKHVRATHPHTVERDGVVTCQDYADPAGLVLGG